MKKSYVLIPLALLLRADFADAGTLADSKAAFTGVQGENGWRYGYRNLSTDGGADDPYDPVGVFIPFNGGSNVAGAYNGTTQQFNATSAVQPMFWLGDGTAPPWIRLGAEFVHPNAGPEMWPMRRYTLTGPAPGGQQARAITWRMRKHIAYLGSNGVTGAVYLNGNKLDEATIPLDDSTGIQRTVFVNVPTGIHNLDLVLKANGNHNADGTWQSLVVSDSIPAAPVQPDGSLFIPLPVVDADGDGLPDVWENYHAGNLAALGPAPADRDGDGSTDAAEYAAGTSPTAGNGPVQRWSFNEKPGALAAAEFKNEVTSALKAEARGWGLRGTGRGVSVPGGAQTYAGYIDLSNRIISGYDSCTIEGWVSVDANGHPWSRIFDFGDRESMEVLTADGTGYGKDSLFLTAATGAYPLGDYANQLFSWRNQSTQGLPSSFDDLDRSIAAPTTFGRTFHFAVTIEARGGGVSRCNVWRDGSRVVTDADTGKSLAQLNDVNNWLGRSNWWVYDFYGRGNDPGVAATFDEFRIYPRALTETEILASRTAGPDDGLPDTDGDGMPDYWERMFTTSESATALPPGSDTDTDGLTALQEYQNYSDPKAADTDSDGMNDGAEVTAGRLPHFAELTTVTYSGPVNPGDWHTAGNWSGGTVPNDTATQKFHARYASVGELQISNPVTVSKFEGTGDTTIKGSGPGVSLTVTGTLSAGVKFVDMGTVTAGQPQRGGLWINSRTGYSGGDLFDLVNTQLVNNGPDGLITAPSQLRFFSGAQLVNEGRFYFPIGAWLVNADANAGNHIVNRGTFTFDADQIFKVNTVTEGGVWDVRRGSLYMGTFAGAAPTSHTMDDATLRLAEGTMFRLEEQATATFSGNSFIEGDGSVLLIGGTLRQEGDNLAAKSLILERGTLSSTTNAHLRAENLELRHGTIQFPGELSTSGGFQFRNKQDFYSDTWVRLRETKLDMLGTANSWNKTDGGGLTFGNLAKIHLHPNALFTINGYMPSSLEPGAVNTEFQIDGDLVLATGASATLAPPVNLNGKILSSLGSGDLYLSNGARLNGLITLGGNNLHISSGTVDVETFGEVQGLGTVVVGHASSSVPFHINSGPGFSAPNLDFYGADVDAPVQRTIFTGNLTTRAGSRFRRVNLEVAGGMKMLTHPLGGNYTISLRDGTHVYARGPGSQFFDAGLAGQGSTMVLGEGSVFENFGEMEINGNRLTFSPETASSDGPPPVSANSGAFFNQGTLKIKCLVIVHHDVGYANRGMLRVENGGSLVLQGRLDNGGDLVITGSSASLSVDQLIAQANEANTKVAAEDGGILGFLKKLFCGEAKASNGGTIDGPSLSELQASKVEALYGGTIGAGGIVAPGAGGGIVAPGAGGGIVATGPGAQVISKGNGGIVASGAGGVIYANLGGQIVAVGAGGNIVASGAGGGIVASGAGSGIVASGAGGGIVASGAGSGFRATGGGIISSGAGGQIVGAGAGGGIVASGAGSQIIAPGAGGNIVAPGAGIILQALQGGQIVAPGAGGGIVASGAGGGIVAAGAGIVGAGAGVTVGPQSFLKGHNGFVNAPNTLMQGLLAGGASPGLMTFNGDLELTSTSRFESEIGGTNQGVDYDLIDVNGGVILDGRLEVVLYGGFVPVGAQSFTVLTADEPLVGAFDNVVGGRVMTADNKGSFAVNYTNGGKDLELGDFQTSSVFGYAAWVSGSGHFTTAEQADPNVSGENADPNGDGLSNQLSYALGLDPRSSSGATGQRLEPIEGGYRFVYTRAKNVVGRFSVETSPSLELNSWSPVEVVPYLISETEASETWEVLLYTAEKSLFVRLVFTP